MSYHLSLLAVLASLLLSGCESTFLQRLTSHNKPLSWIEYDSRDPGKRDARINLLKRKTLNCFNNAHCAELHFQIAILFLNSKPLIPKDLKPATHHLNKAMQDGRYMEHARVLNKVLHGWINETNKNKKLRTNLERAKEVDLEIKHN